MDINGKNIILTGASSGIGLEVLKQLSRHESVKIIAVARNTSPIPPKEGVVYPYSCDVSNKEGVDKLFLFAETIFDKVDLFIANAGFAYIEKLSSPDWDHIEQIFSLNTISPIYSLEKQIEFNKTGSSFFVSISSAVSTVALPYYSLYCSTKAAIRQFMKTYRFEQSQCVHTMTVYPVATRTEFFKKALDNTSPPLPFPTQSPITVAKAIIRGIEKDKTSVSPSAVFRLFNYAGNIFPPTFSIYSLLEKRKLEKSGTM